MPVVVVANAPASVGSILLQVGGGMEVETVNLVMTESQEERKRKSAMWLSSLSPVAAGGSDVGGERQLTVAVRASAEAHFLEWQLKPNPPN